MELLWCYGALGTEYRLEAGCQGVGPGNLEPDARKAPGGLPTHQRYATMVVAPEDGPRGAEGETPCCTPSHPSG